MGNTELPKSSPSNRIEPSRWQENHGNLLVGMIAIILVAGSAIIAYRQLSFQPPRFPSGVHQTASIDPLLLAEGDQEGLRVVAIQVFGAASDAGMMQVAVYTGEDGFNDPAQAWGSGQWPIISGMCEGRFSVPVEVEELAVAVYHDENSNGELDRNVLGIPAERYGFSGDARGLSGPPAYAEAVVPLTDEPIQISIR